MSSVDNKDVVDVRRLNQMKVAILEAERRNLNTSEKNNDQMVDLIKRTIQSIADKSF